MPQVPAQAAIFGRRLLVVGQLMSALQQHDPAQPHWYLFYIGAEPVHHGRGLGSALLAHTLAVCDRDRIPAYLEASTSRNAALYLRHGFVRPGATAAARRWARADSDVA